MQPTDVDVTVVLPVYNEAGHLDEEIDRTKAALAASEFTYELLVVDDGSTDGSRELLQRRDDIRLIGFHGNRGSGSARKVGTEAARGRIVVWTDVDMTYPNDRIPWLVRQLDGYDHVVGARTSEQGTVPFLRTPAKWLIRMLAQILSGQRIDDLNSGLRAFRRDVAVQYTHLLPAGFSCVTTITLAFLTNGYSVRYVPIDYFERAGDSKFHWWTDTRRYVLQIVRMILMFNPLKVLAPLGLLLLAVGVGKTAYDVITDPITIAINTIVLLLAALTTLLVALLSDLIVQLTKPPAHVLPAAAYESDPGAATPAGADV